MKYEFRWQEFYNPDPDSEVIKLKEHIASGEKSTWAVSTINSHIGTFDNYDDANKAFEATPADQKPTLVLYTRVGTLCVFRFKEPPKEDE